MHAPNVEAVLRIDLFLKNVPFLWRYAEHFQPRFPGSEQYWDRRYAEGGNSGAGSYGELANFKANFLNAFVLKNGITSVVELGCGDGNQLSLASYPRYVGLDVSRAVLQRTICRFRNDDTKSFFLYDGTCFADRQRMFRSDLGLSLDVIYHLIEDAVFERYMTHLFGMANKYVIIYSSNHDEILPNAHVRHRQFTAHVKKEFLEWAMIELVKNQFPMAEVGEEKGSFVDFFVFERK